MSALKAIALVVGVSVLYFGLIYVGGAFTGAGHGSDFFVAAMLAPFSASEVLAPCGMILWPAVAVLLALRRFPACRIAAAAALALHYSGIVIVSFQTEWFYVGKVWHSLPGVVVAFVAIYFGSQAFMWWLIIRTMTGWRPYEGSSGRR